MSEPSSQSASSRPTGVSRPSSAIWATFAALSSAFVVVGVCVLYDGGNAHAASRQRTALWPPNPNAFESATGRWPLASSLRAVFGT